MPTRIYIRENTCDYIYRTFAYSKVEEGGRCLGQGEGDGHHESQVLPAQA